jgi:hypothetical protein
MKSPRQLITAIHDEEGDGQTPFSKSGKVIPILIVMLPLKVSMQRFFKCNLIGLLGLFGQTSRQQLKD